MAAAALQQAPITFRFRSLPSAKLHSTLTVKSFFSIGLKLPKLTIKPRKRGGGGALSAAMSDSAASRYAVALADVAKSNNTLEQTSADLESVGKIFSDPAVSGFFTNPVIDDEKKIPILNEIAKDANLQPHVVNFLNILLDMKRIGVVSEIVKEFEIIYNKLTDTELAIVTSVVPLEPQHLTQIAKEVQKLAGAKNVRIKTQIDPSLVAGFTIRYGSSASKLIDMSVKKQLEEIASQLEIGDITLAG